jgi:ABC-type protease/lipase transport system fused ATPase/permease subunit
MVLSKGQVQAFGPKDEVLRQTTQPAVPPGQTRLKVISEGPTAQECTAGT